MRKCALARIFKVRFRIITSCIDKLYHENMLAETCISFKVDLLKHTKKWSGSVITAATET